MDPRRFQRPLYGALGVPHPGEPAAQPNAVHSWLAGQYAPPASTGTDLAQMAAQQAGEAMPRNPSPAAPNVRQRPVMEPRPPMPAPVSVASTFPVAPQQPAPVPAQAAQAPVQAAPPQVPGVPASTTPVAPGSATAAPQTAIAPPPAPSAPNQWGIDFSQPMVGVPGLPGSNRPGGWSSTMEALNNPNAPDPSGARSWAADPRSNPNNTMGVFFDPSKKAGDVSGYYNDFINPALRTNPNGTQVSLEQAGIAPGSSGDPTWNPSPAQAPGPPPVQPWTSPDAGQAELDYDARNAAAPPPAGAAPPPVAVAPPPTIKQPPGAQGVPKRNTFMTALHTAAGNAPAY